MYTNNVAARSLLPERQVIIANRYNCQSECIWKKYIVHRWELKSCVSAEILVMYFKSSPGGVGFVFFSLALAHTSFPTVADAPCNCSIVHTGLLLAWSQNILEHPHK